MKEKKKQKIGLWKYIKRHLGGFVGYLILDVIAAACTVLITICLADAASLAVGTTNVPPNFEKAIYTLLFTCGLYFVRRICWNFSFHIYNRVVNKIMIELNYDVANQTFKLTSKTFSDNNTGTFVQRMVHEPENVVRTFAQIIDVFTATVTSLVIIIYVATLNVYVGLVIFGIIGLSSLIERFRLKKLRANQKILKEKTDKVNSISTEIVRSEKDIKSLGLEEKLSEVQKNYYSDFKQANYKQDRTNVNFNHIKQIILEFGGIAVLIVGIILMKNGGLGEALAASGTFMLIYSNHNQLYGLVWNLGNILDYFTRLKVSCDRMFGLFNENEFPAEKFGNTHLDRIKGKIDFKRVEFSFVEYEPKPDLSKMTRKERREYKKNPPDKKVKSTNKIFNQLSFSIKPNTTVAFVGKSGSGKSTILNLMSKMYEVDGGEVLIDGVNINDLDKETLRNNISLVNQFPYIFDMTIKENLFLANKNATDEQIEDCIAKASLTEFIATLPEGLNTKVGESGIKLSGGQKQRLAIARALLRNSPVIIFDESTSSLDNFAQEDIKRTLDGLKGQGTIVIVAHRLSTIRNADKIFFLDEGNIIDQGTFDYLFENNTKFRNMFYAENI